MPWHLGPNVQMIRTFLDLKKKDQQTCELAGLASLKFVKTVLKTRSLVNSKEKDRHWRKKLYTFHCAQALCQTNSLIHDCCPSALLSAVTRTFVEVMDGNLFFILSFSGDRLLCKPFHVDGKLVGLIRPDIFEQIRTFTSGSQFYLLHDFPCNRSILDKNKIKKQTKTLCVV